MLSLADDLTGLYNRRGLFALGEHLMRRRDATDRTLDGAVRGRRRTQGASTTGYGHAGRPACCADVATALRAAIA